LIANWFGLYNSDRPGAKTSSPFRPDRRPVAFGANHCVARQRGSSLRRGDGEEAATLGTSGAASLLLAAHSPELNCIEIVWKHVKYFWRRFVAMTARDRSTKSDP
jgi:hypothetical protein